MTNEQKYKTTEERISKFQRFCDKQEGCTKCAAVNDEGTRSSCAFHWLALEAEEKPDPCPFCESSCTAHKGVDMVRPHVSCDNEWCGYRSAEEPTIEDAIAAHNRVCRAVKAAAKRERDATREKSSQVGNEAAMREAVEYALDRLLLWNYTNRYTARMALGVVNKLNAAIAAPPRNCDRPECATTKSAQDVWRKEDGGKTEYYEWLLATSTKGEENGIQ